MEFKVYSTELSLLEDFSDLPQPSGLKTVHKEPSISSRTPLPIGGSLPIVELDLKSSRA
jgi:hypothetical protein